MSQPKIKFTFENPHTGHILKLTYELSKGNFYDRWFELFLKGMAWPQNYPIETFFGAIIDSEENLVEKMRKTVAYLNANCGNSIEKTPHLGMDQAKLDYFHKHFECLDFLHIDSNNFELKNALQDLNLLVHRLETIKKKKPGCFVEVLWQETYRDEFKDEDWQLFSPNFNFGSMYITYGTTGVPPLSAFYNNTTNSRPISQPNFSNGINLWFQKDSEFNKWEQLNQYLQQWGMSSQDEKIAIGYITVAKLITPYSSQEDLNRQIANHQKLLSVCAQVADQTLEVCTIKKPDLPAVWPYNKEIFYHLDLVPYIDLNLSFKTEYLLAEAQALESKFVTHRNYDQTSQSSAKWKSLALRALDGKPTKTAYHWEYGIKDNPNYKMTKIAKWCPEVMKLVDFITDTSHCERIRFMLLEPGAKINVHRDSDLDVCMAINISLNMPEGCQFFIDANADGTKGEFTKEVPFSNEGSVMLINVAKYHFVENNSDVPRFHIIIHGPNRIGDQRILAAARKQNKLFNRRDVVKELVKKKAKLGEIIARDSDLYHDWNALGIVADSMEENISLVILEESRPKDLQLQTECVQKITAASLFPIPYVIVESDNLDRWLTDKNPNDKRFICIISAGTFIRESQKFIFELIQATAQMKKSNAAICGHIMDRSDSAKDIPFLHEQFLILDLQKWTELGQVPLGNFYGNETIDFPAYFASQEKYHDDYTPYWIKNDSLSSVRNGRKWFGTELMAKSIEASWPIINVPQALRETKSYAYPIDGESPQYKEVKTEIADFCYYAGKKVFFFNNEPPRVLEIPKFEPTKLVSVAAGFKAVGIMQQYFQNQRQLKTYFLDHNTASLEYIENLMKVEGFDECVDYIFRSMASNEGHVAAQKTSVKLFLQGLLSDYFADDFTQLVTQLKKIKGKASFQKADFVHNHKLILDVINIEDKTLFWHSNAWNCNSLLFTMTSEEAEANYLQLANQIKEKLGLKGWKKQNAFESIFGKSQDDIHTVLTDGASSQGPINWNCYREL